MSHMVYAFFKYAKLGIANPSNKCLHKMRIAQSEKNDGIKSTGCQRKTCCFSKLGKGQIAAAR